MKGFCLNAYIYIHINAHTCACAHHTHLIPYVDNITKKEWVFQRQIFKIYLWGFGNYGVNEIVLQNKKILLAVYNFESEVEGLIIVGKELTSTLKVLFILKGSVWERQWRQSEIEVCSRSEAMENKALYVSHIMQNVPYLSCRHQPSIKHSSVTLSFHCAQL